MGIAVSTDYRDIYGDLDRMPDKLRRIYNKIVAKLSADGYTVRPGNRAVVVPKLNARVIAPNGEFTSADEMPPRTRQMFEDALVAMLPVENALCAIIDAQLWYQRAAFRGLLITLAFELAAAAFLATRGYFGHL
jgi:hypothetical protein